MSESGSWPRFSLWSLVILLTANVAFLSARELPLRNPGFEVAAAGSSAPADWSLAEWTGGPADILLERVSGGRRGGHAAKVTWRSGGSNILLYQALAVQGRQRYRLSFFFKTDGRTGVSCSIRTLRGSQALQYNSSPESRPARQWTKHVFEFTTHPACDQLVIYLRQRAGTVWYDDVSLETIPLPKPVDWRSPAAVTAWERFAPKTRRLNCLATRLLDVNPGESMPPAERKYAFVTPREGWVHITVKLAKPGPMPIRVRLDSGPEYVLRHPHGAAAATPETMLHLTAGAHTLRIPEAGGQRLVRVRVCAIPELICCEYESAASGREALMKRHPHLLDDYNVTLENFYRHHQKDVMRTESMDPASRTRLAAWKTRGGRAFTHSTIPGLTQKRVHPNQSFEFWSRALGMRELDGIMCDEFGHETPEQLSFYTRAIRRLAAEPRFANKTIYAYGPPSWGSAPTTRGFRETLFRYGHKQALEMYLREAPTKAAAKAEIARVLTQWVGSADLDLPGSAPCTTLVLCCCSKAYYGMDCYPNADFRVFLDLQYHEIANNPVFTDLGGLSAWILRSADDEIIRWMGLLNRHYAIEGKRSLLSAEYGLTYHLNHVRNPAFQAGFDGWMIHPAGPGSMSVIQAKGFGIARGTMCKSPVGDAVVLLRRNGPKANRLSQTLRHLVPGALYSIQLYTADANGWKTGKSRNRIHALRVSVEDAELLPGRYEREVYDRPYGGGNRAKRTWFNLHRWEFRPARESARLTIQDGPAGDAIDQALMLNFVQVQRCIPDAGDRLPSAAKSR